jgi:hypothetical protein
MSSFSGIRSFQTVEYTLMNPGLEDRQFSVEGPVVGTYADQSIPAAVVDHCGHRYHYVGLAPRLRDGRFDVRSLRLGEWIVEPGLVYMSDAVVGLRSSTSTRRR